MKILTVLGARPQFIKAGPVSREIKRRRENGDNIREVIVHTGQHYDKNMSDVFFKELRLPHPDYFLGIGGKSHGKMTGEMIVKLEEVMIKEKPDVVLVYGDTNSTLAGAIAASKLHIPIAHIEAGLRSFNMKMPEEINRVLTDRISKWLFCPTDTAVENLKREGFENFNCRIVKTGDVMLDAALYYKQFAKRPNINLENEYILCTIHRAENTEDRDRLRNIFESLEEIAREIQVILPLHPRTRKKLKEMNIEIKNVTLIDPVSYLEMVWLLDNCKLVMTDSGGLQKEAFFFGKYCVVFREETEWRELIERNFLSLAGASKRKIMTCYKLFSQMQEFSYDVRIFGDGRASRYILRELMK